MELKELAIILIGCISAIFVLNVLNTMFASEVPFFLYVGSGSALGIFVIIGGFVFLKLVEGHVGA